MIAFDRPTDLVGYYKHTDYRIPEWAREEHLDWLIPLKVLWRCL